MCERLTFSGFIKGLSGHDDQLCKLLNGMTAAARTVSQMLCVCVFEQQHTSNGELNVQGEWQQHMDVYAEQQFIQALKESGACCLAISEEQADVIRLETSRNKLTPSYIVALDPLDGSSNVEVNVPVGSIFSVYRRENNDDHLLVQEVLKKGDEQIAAGYFLYGHSTMFVYTDGSGVNGFTLDTSIGEFVLSHPNIRVAENGTLYAINEANYYQFHRGPQNFIRYCRQRAIVGDEPFSARYSGSMVSDIHRILMCGGIFLYPKTLSAPKGKLRLAYECFPIAFIMETAGGMATTGNKRVLDITLQSLHQRSPIVIGSRNLVITAERFINTSIPNSYELNG